MPATEAVFAYGTTISIDGVTIGEVKSIGNVKFAQAAIDATHLASPGGMDEHVPGRGSVGDVPLRGNFVPGDTGQAALAAAAIDKALHDFVITFPDDLGTTWTFAASVAEWGTTEADMENIVGFEASLKVSGESTLGVTYSTGLTTPFFAVSGAGTTILPTPAGNVYEYVVNVATGITSVTVTPTATAGTITVNGVIVATGEASSAITLGDAGSVTEITIKVVEANKAARTYTLWVARAAS